MGATHAQGLTQSGRQSGSAQTSGAKKGQDPDTNERIGFKKAPGDLLGPRCGMSAEHLAQGPGFSPRTSQGRRAQRKLPFQT